MDNPQPGHGDQVFPKASVRIIEHVRFQKYRYRGENRPGKKNHKKEFMTLQVSNLPGNSVRVRLVCVDADSQEVKVHPNGLIGVGCRDGLFDVTYPVAASQHVFNIAIPYIRIERTKFKKESKEIIQEQLEKRMSYLPSPYQEHFTSQCAGVVWSKDLDTAKVRIAVIISSDGGQGWPEKLCAVSNVIKDGSQNTSLDILKISCNHVPALTGAWIDVFTGDSSPPIKAGEYNLYVTYQPPGETGKVEHWISQETSPGEDCIIYNKVISYKVPPYEPNLYLKCPVTATLHLVCSESNLSSSCSFYYVPERGVTEQCSQNDVVGVTEQCSQNVVAGVTEQCSQNDAAGVTALCSQNDAGSLNDVNLRRQGGTKRSARCEPFEDSEIAASVKIKPRFQGETTSQIRSNRNTIPLSDFRPLTSDVQRSNVKLTGGHDSETRNMINLLPAADTGGRTSSRNNWMTTAPAHHGGQPARRPYTNVKTYNRRTQSEINMENYQPTPCSHFELLASKYPDSVTKQGSSFVQQIGNNSRNLSMASCHAQRPCCNVAANDINEAKSGCSNSQRVISQHSQFVPQSTAQPQNSCIILPRSQSPTGNDITDHVIDNQLSQVISDLIEYLKRQKQTTELPQSSRQSLPCSQNRMSEDNPNHVTENQHCKAVSDLIKCDQQTTNIYTHSLDLGQISHNFQAHSDSSEVCFLNQTTPTGTPGNQDTYMPTNLDTLNLFTDKAENLSTLDFFKYLSDIC